MADKTITITIKASLEEKKMIEDKAKKRGMSVSAYLRYLALIDKGEI